VHIRNASARADRVAITSVHAELPRRGQQRGDLRHGTDRATGTTMHANIDHTGHLASSIVHESNVDAEHGTIPARSCESRFETALDVRTEARSQV
jgi:hypothetical protein